MMSTSPILSPNHLPNPKSYRDKFKSTDQKTLAIIKPVVSKVNPSTPQHRLGLALGLSSGRRLRVDPEWRVKLRLKDGAWRRRMGQVFGTIVPPFFIPPPLPTGRQAHPPPSRGRG
jgi:hypothetical protein